jgi:phosphate starvation-inducible PhoH-like protein
MLRVSLLFVLLSKVSGFKNNNLRKVTTVCLAKKTKNIFKSEESQELYSPKSKNQVIYNNLLNDSKTKIIFGVGPAGTGKTLLACNSAIQQFKNKKIDKIVLTRPIVPVEEDIGFLPGTVNKKMEPWLIPIMDIFLEYYSKKQIDEMIYNNTIDIAPLTFMRGRTFKNAFIIADEMQNSSPNQMLMLLTRIGMNSKMVITGDIKQTDKPEKSGLSNFIDKFSNYKKKVNDIAMVEMNTDDIQRNPIISTILDIYES